MKKSSHHFEDDIHLWFACTSEMTDQILLAQYQKLLSQEERQTLQRFIFPEDRQEFLLAKVLLRVTLSEYLSIPPENIQFSKGPYGKPFLENPKAQKLSKRLAFNLTHSHGLALLALSKRASIGVDVEHISHNKDMMHIAQTFFAQEEVQTLRGLPDTERKAYFYRCWTLKEAYVKAIGKGLSYPLSRLGFYVDVYGRVIGGASSKKKWDFASFYLSESHVGALCMHTAQQKPLTIKIWRTLPLVTKEAVKNLIFSFS